MAHTVRTEVFGWMGSAAMGGAAIGSAVSGAVVENFGVRYVWLVAAVLAALSLALLFRIPPQQPRSPAPEPSKPDHIQTHPLEHPT